MLLNTGPQHRRSQAGSTSRSVVAEQAGDEVSSGVRGSQRVGPLRGSSELIPHDVRGSTQSVDRLTGADEAHTKIAGEVAAATGHDDVVVPGEGRLQQR